VDFWRGVRFLVIAGPILVLAILLFIVENLRDDPRRLGTSDILRGGFTALVGVVFVLGAAYYFRRAAKGRR
jgi:hypothetical protein